jgi:Laminin B (Domain IV)
MKIYLSSIFVVASFLCLTAANSQAAAFDINRQIVATRSLDADSPSDSFAGRTFTSAYPLRLAASNSAATKEPGEPDHGRNSGGHSVWWGWTAPSPGEVSVTTAGSDFDTLLAVYSGNTLTSLTTIDSQDRGKTDEQITFHATAGASYNIALDGYAGQTGNAVVNLSFVPSPPNDDFANRIVLSGYPASVTTTNAAATKEPGEPALVAGYAGGASVWWSWTAPVTGMLTVTTEGTAYDALLSIWTGTSVSTLTSIAQQDRQPFESITIHALAGIPYALAIDGYQGRSGKTVLNLSFVPSPVNDDFVNRTTLTGADISLTVSNLASSFEPGEPAHAGKVGGKSVWWTWAPTGNGPAIISTEGSTFDTLLAVYTGPTLSRLAEVVSKDLALGDTVAFEATAGTAYQIAVDGYNAREGVFPLRLTQSVSIPLSSSSFDSGVDFWTVVSLPDTGPFTNVVGGPYIPNYISTNGNPGGYISQSDPDGATWFWNAPVKLLGDQSAAYGGFLKFDLRQSATDSPFSSADVILTGQGITLVFAYTNHPGTDWTSYNIRLVESAGWKTENLDGAIPTQADFQAVLKSMTALRIRGEYRTGGDVGDLDNVAWIAPAGQTLFDNGNIFGVQSGPGTPTTFTLQQPTVITDIQNYHYFNNGALPGTISLRHEDGTLYGPWQTHGLSGQGGVSNAYWIAEPMVQVKAGKYTVIDSDPATWSHNSGSDFAGFTFVKGYAAGVESPELRISLDTDGSITLSWPGSATDFVLFRSATIDTVSSWSRVTDRPALVYGRFVIRYQPEFPSQFYQLVTGISGP